MPITRPFCILCPAMIISLLAIVALMINHFHYHYIGNNYFPPDTPVIAFSLLLIYIGSILEFGPKSTLATILKEVFYFFIVMAVIALATNAVQYTPYPTIDRSILSFEQSLHIDMPDMLAWTDKHLKLKTILFKCYESLSYQMSVLPLLVITARRFNLIREYYFLLLTSTLIGFLFYYFYPTTAPASIIQSLYFTEAQKATGLKFLQIHQHLQPTTIEGGMIALPSFHMIWGWFCLYLIRCWRILFFMLLPINLLLMTSCVLLGWHYPSDLVGGAAIILITHSLHYWCKNRVCWPKCPQTLEERIHDKSG